jgi:plasmid stability protein
VVTIAQQIVRNLDADLVKRLRPRAAEHGRSAEEEHRVILRGALRPRRETSLKRMLLAIPDAGSDRDVERHDDLGREIDW